jgi:hypothetical protein
LSSGLFANIDFDRLNRKPPPPKPSETKELSKVEQPAKKRVDREEKVPAKPARFTNLQFWGKKWTFFT